MEKWKLIKLGEVDAYTCTAIFEAVAIAKSKGMIGNTLILCRPPVCVMFAQADMSQINLSFCKEQNIPICRHFGAGGVMLLGNNIECVLASDRKFFPSKPNVPLIKSLVEACKILGLTANRRKNDVIVREKKLCGTAVGQLKDTQFFGTIFTLGFDYELAKKVLRISPEKFKDKKAKTVSEWVTSVGKELKRDVSYKEGEDALVQGFSKILGVQFEETKLTPELEDLINELVKTKYSSNEWLTFRKWSPVKDYREV